MGNLFSQMLCSHTGEHWEVSEQMFDRFSHLLIPAERAVFSVVAVALCPFPREECWPNCFRHIYPSGSDVPLLFEISFLDVAPSNDLYLCRLTLRRDFLIHLLLHCRICCKGRNPTMFDNT